MNGSKNRRRFDRAERSRDFRSLSSDQRRDVLDVVAMEVRDQHRLNGGDAQHALELRDHLAVMLAALGDGMPVIESVVYKQNVTRLRHQDRAVAVVRGVLVKVRQ